MEAPAEQVAVPVKVAVGPAHRIPSLDGLRAFSISLVLLGHLLGTRGFPLTDLGMLRVIDIANFGVRIFFVISGFLITGLLLQELKQTGRISLRHFYFRRVLRIFPAYYTFLLALAIASALGLARISEGAILRAASYTVDHDANRQWLVGHAWSLSVEEQFYILWPLALVALGLRRGVGVAAAFVVIIPVIRVGLLALPKASVPVLTHNIGMSFETVADALAVGCLLAALRQRLWAEEWYRKLVTTPLFPVIPLAAFAIGALASFEVQSSHWAIMRPLERATGISQVYFLWGFYNAVGITLMNVAIALTIDRLVRFPEGVVGRILNWSPVVSVGVLSYSLYLWQQPFLNRNSTATAASFPLNLCLAALVAVGSYQLVEKPGLRFRRYLETRWVKAH
jgi:peptidoglycan/LPS O-acetylase OafA/YrhL